MVQIAVLLSSVRSNTGQLSCAICNCNVKNELLWNAHIQSKKHKESVLNLKAQSNKVETKHYAVNKKVVSQNDDSSTFAKPTLPDSKRKQSVGDDEQSELAAKKLKVDEESVNKSEGNSLPSDFFDSGSASSTSTNTTEEAKLTANSLVGKYDDDEEDSEDEDEENDSGKNETANEQQPVKGTLPEGFFDDPVVDANVRHVEYKPKIDVEYEKFQKEIAKEEQKSDAIVEVDDVEAQLARDTLEVVEQLVCEEKIDTLRKAREMMKAKQLAAANARKKLDNDSDDDSEESEDEFFDWRAKKA
ncbi:uncharacterized protein TRIADDRAFT_62010 [Trichoplax adhaerens]|uniref:Zinc finger protein 830 n=1 Tax=Trichoplax adhaerens TaxID=10228 RepID=B3SCL0_TRIAD|nr:hypothetical protein TRIADDRAFT_62010 [Trichoplax adhaerens]EDV19533.1 hypothetical protein TRIADDRAFT_62010 [Trichoplax adhaerens]|eukprot:XP_002117965.1 hypothetical protein TRIADDRAFT_62010 [Trichoplax adhaerens]